MTISVLVITRDYDITADVVVADLQRRGVRVARFDLADYPERLSQIAYLVNGRTQWTGALRGVHRDIDLSAVRSIWYRKPSQFAVHPEMTTTEQQWAAAEAQAGFGGLLAALPGVRWVNHPHRNAEAEYKPHQLAAAAAAGLMVPDTLLTNDPVQARDFCSVHREQGVVYKPLRGGPRSEAGHHVVLWATEVTAEDVTDAVRRTTHLFQARVPCAYPVRMTIVGHRLFAVRMDAPGDGTTLDWRTFTSEELTYTPIDVPTPVATGIKQVMGTFGLTYAAADWIVTPDGEWVFHGDLNPNGQWGWIAGHTGLPIAEAIADELTQGAA